MKGEPKVAGSSGLKNASPNQASLLPFNAFDVVEAFERKVAEFCGAPYCVSTSTGTAAIFLSLRLEYFTIKNPSSAFNNIRCPANTFISVPMAIKQAGFGLKLIKREWRGVYDLPPTRVIDAALRFRRNMYLTGSLTCLSFHARKLLNIGEGGAILTDDRQAAFMLRSMRYSGRNAENAFDVQRVTHMGYQLYMTPEKAARGLHLLEYMQHWSDSMDQGCEYPDLREAPFFKSDQ